MRHYAGVVTYRAQGILEKNKDTQQDQLFELMYNSNNAFVEDLTRFQVRYSLTQGQKGAGVGVGPGLYKSTCPILRAIRTSNCDWKNPVLVGIGGVW